MHHMQRISVYIPHVVNIVETAQDLRDDIRDHAFVVVAEGAKFKTQGEVLQEEKLDEFGHVRLGGIGQVLAREIENVLSIETPSPLSTRGMSR